MDNTPPRNRLIALYTALAVATLLGLKPAFDAYFDRMHVAAVAQGVERGFVDTTVIGAPAEARRATERALEGQTGLSDCLAARLAEVPGLTGSLDARVRNENGVVSAQVDGGIEDEAFRACVSSALEGLSGMPSGEVRLHIEFAPTEADFIKLGWQRALETAPTPIDDAMGRVAQGRLADPSIRPRRVGPMNLDPLRGWTRLPRELPRSVQQAQQPAPEAPAAPEGGVAPAGEPAPEGGAAPAGEPAPEAAPPPEAAPAPEAAAPVRPRPSPRPRPAPEPEATE